MWSNELKHYGILGMKWGVRRYQNEDGTLTTAGKQRYGTTYTTASTTGDGDTKKDSSSNKELVSKLTAQTIKGGKDKPNVSPMEKTIGEAGKIVNSVDRMRRRNAAKAKQNDNVVKSMSDEELRERINRMNLEKQYNDLTSNDTNTGFATVQDVLAIVGSIASIYVIVKDLKS